MGLTIHYQLLTDSKDKIDKITEKWEKEYAPEFEYYGITHRFKEVKDEPCYFQISESGWGTLGDMRLDTHEKVQRWMGHHAMKEVPELPHTAKEFVDMMYEPVEFVRFGSKPIKEVPEERVKDLRYTSIYSGVYFGKPDRPDPKSIATKCNGFLDTPQNTETFGMDFAEVAPDKFYATNFVKTQPFEMAAFEKSSRAHMLICDFLNDVKDSGLAKVAYNDEGRYCETGDADVLARAFKGNLDVIDSVGGMLAGAGWKKEEIQTRKKEEKSELGFRRKVEIPKEPSMEEDEKEAALAWKAEEELEPKRETKGQTRLNGFV